MTAEQILTGATRVRVQYLTENAIRITHSPASAEAFPPDRPWLRHVLLPTPEINASESRLVVDLQDGRVRVRNRAGAVIVAEARAPQLGLSRRMRSVTVDIPATEVRTDFGRVREAVGLALKIEPGEGFYGWGEWFSAFRRERGTVRLKIRDAISLVQNRETYSAIPFFISSRGYGFWLLNSYESEWRIDAERGELKIEAAGPGADYIVIHGPAYRDVVGTYTQLTGRPPLIPRWAFGLMVTGYPQEPQSVVLERAQEHRRRSIPLDDKILKNIHVDREKMRKNIDLTQGRVMSESVMLTLAEKGMGRQEAHSLIRDLALQSEIGQQPFKDILKSNSNIRKWLSEEDIDKVLTPEKYLGTAVIQVKNIIKKTEREMKARRR